MTITRSTQRIAVLIDSDNVSTGNLLGVLSELARHGTTSVHRMYGDWTSDRLRGWKNSANEHSVQPIQQFSYATTAGRISPVSARPCRTRHRISRILVRSATPSESLRA